MRVLVFSQRHRKFAWMSLFPHVRGHVLAKYLRQLGVDAEFRALPVPGHYDVAICSDYQGDARWLELLLSKMIGLSARRYLCMVDYGISGYRGPQWAPMTDWFAARGGVLCHMREQPLEPWEHFIGLGVDDVVRFDPTRDRRAIFFDFPTSARRDSSASFAAERLDTVRRAFPEHRLLGSGAAGSAIRDAFDEWLPYGQPHDEYVARFADCCAFVPGTPESMGLAIAEAQVAGMAIVAPDGWVKAEIVVPSARVADDDLVRGLQRAAERDAARIAAEAGERFSPLAMARRALDAIEAVG